MIRKETTNLLIIEDDEIVARTIERSLRGNDFCMTIASSGVEGLKIARRQPLDLVILDIVMPGMDGYTVCREMRSDPLLTDIPILFLTAKAKDEDRIAGFMAGADDYLVKPFNIDELALRIRAILRRVKKYNSQKIGRDVDQVSKVSEIHEGIDDTDDDKLGHVLRIGDFVLNVRSYELSIPGKGKIRLTPVQYDLLYHLMSHPGEVFSPSRLLDEVWDYPSDAGSPDLVRVHIKNLRERIELDPRNPQFIQTIAGYGYSVHPSNG